MTISAAGRRPPVPSTPPPLDKGVSLFLDFDGTLVDLMDRPNDVVVDTELCLLLLALQQRLEGRLAIVSGRSLAQLDTLLGDVAHHLILAASHGTEYRRAGRTEAPVRPDTLDRVAMEMCCFAEQHRGVLLEQKSFGVALHYRMAPETGAQARILAAQLAHQHGLFLQQGDGMVELRPEGHDKGRAIRQFMQTIPFAGVPPVFLGDDITDEAGFAVASAMGGYGVLVGAARPSAARFRLPAPLMVRHWLKEMSI